MCRHFDADVEPYHQGLAQNGGPHQRQHRTHHRSPGPEGDEAKRDDGRVHHGQQLHVRTLHDDIGVRFDTGIARGAQELDLIGVMDRRKLLDGLDHIHERVSLVVLEVGIHRQQVAWRSMT